MGTAEFHYLIGRIIAERQRVLGLTRKSFVSACWEHGVPVYTSSPGDSSIGMNVAALALEGCQLKIDVSRDVNETAAIVLGAKRGGGKSAVLILGGGSPKNFVLQTDTGGLSGATPSEAVSWGKVDPEMLPDTVVCYCDSTIALPLLTAYALANHPPRQSKRLYDRRDDLMSRLIAEYEAAHVFGPDGGFKPRKTS
jgi:deoxyhypusine synthase